VLRVALVFSLLFSGATAARAELIDTFAPFYFDSNNRSEVLLHGEINSRTPLAFSRLVQALPSVERVLLSSPGGNVYAAILVAREVDRLGLSTIIPNDADCFSACAFIYLAGHERISSGRLGVHQVSSQDPDLVAAQVAVSDIIELLTEFDVPNDVFLLMLRTRPEDMHILYPDDLSRLGVLGQRVPLVKELVPNGETVEPRGQERRQPDGSLLAEGTYSSGGLTVVIDGGLVGITITEQGCIGAFDGEMREQEGMISFVGDGCSIGVTKLGPFDFSMDQGPGCTYYHGAACDLSGYVRRSN